MDQRIAPVTSMKYNGRRYLQLLKIQAMIKK